MVENTAERLRIAERGLAFTIARGDNVATDDIGDRLGHMIDAAFAHHDAVEAAKATSRRSRDEPPTLSGLAAEDAFVGAVTERSGFFAQANGPQQLVFCEGVREAYRNWRLAKVLP